MERERGIKRLILEAAAYPLVTGLIGIVSCGGCFRLVRQIFIRWQTIPSAHKIFIVNILASVFLVLLPYAMALFFACLLFSKKTFAYFGSLAATGGFIALNVQVLLFPDSLDPYKEIPLSWRDAAASKILILIAVQLPFWILSVRAFFTPKLLSAFNIDFKNKKSATLTTVVIVTATSFLLFSASLTNLTFVPKLATMYGEIRKAEEMKMPQGDASDNTTLENKVRAGNVSD